VDFFHKSKNWTRRDDQWDIYNANPALAQVVVSDFQQENFFQ